MAKLVVGQTQYSGENGRFVREYVDKKLYQHRDATPLDHPNGSVNLDKLDEEAKAYFAKTSELEAVQDDVLQTQAELADVQAEVATKQTEWLVTTTGTNTAYTTTLSPAPESLYIGMKVTIIPHTDSKGTASKHVTLDVNGFGAKEIKQRGNRTTTCYTPSVGDFLKKGKPATLMYDGGYWIMTEFSRPSWVDLKEVPVLLQPNNIKAGENVSVSASGADVTISSEKTTVEDTLASTSAEAALSAKQGKILNEKIADTQTAVGGKLSAENLVAGDNVDILVSGGNVTISAAGGGSSGGVNIVDNLESTSKISALSANQGRVLDGKITDLNSDLTSQIGTKANASHEHTCEDIADFPVLKAGDNVTIARSGNDVTVSVPAVGDKLEADDIVAGDNVTLNKADGKVTINAQSESFQVGDMLTTLRTDLDDSWLLCNGSGVSAEEYPELAEICLPEILTEWNNKVINTNANVFANDEYVMAIAGNSVYYTNDPATPIATWNTVPSLPFTPTYISHVNGYWILQGGATNTSYKLYNKYAYTTDLTSGTWTTGAIAISGFDTDVYFTSEMCYTGTQYVCGFCCTDSYVLGFGIAYTDNLSTGEWHMKRFNSKGSDNTKCTKVLPDPTQNGQCLILRGTSLYRTTSDFWTSNTTVISNYGIATCNDFIITDKTLIYTDASSTPPYEITVKNLETGATNAIVPYSEENAAYEEMALADGVMIATTKGKKYILMSLDGGSTWFKSEEVFSDTGSKKPIGYSHYMIANDGVAIISDLNQKSLPMISSQGGYTYIKAR